MSQQPTMIVVGADGLRLGTCIHTPDRGWRFASDLSPLRSSRRYWPTAAACVHHWTCASGCELMASLDWRVRRLLAARLAGTIGSDPAVAA